MYLYIYIFNFFGFCAMYEIHMKNFVLNFQALSIKIAYFNTFLTSKQFANFQNFDKFCQHINFKKFIQK